MARILQDLEGAICLSIELRIHVIVVYFLSQIYPLPRGYILVLLPNGVIKVPLSFLSLLQPLLRYRAEFL
jgi:hypothetical protein